MVKYCDNCHVIAARLDAANDEIGHLKHINNLLQGSIDANARMQYGYDAQLRVNDDTNIARDLEQMSNSLKRLQHRIAKRSDQLYRRR